MGISSKAGMTGRARALVAMLLIASVAACAPIYRNHGYVPSQEELDEISVGDSRATVDEVIGAPTTGGMMGEGDYYYVRSRVKRLGMLEPKEIDRQVVAISFDSNDGVQNIERFGLERGRVIALNRRVTSSSVEDKTFFRQLMGNLVNFNPSQFLGSSE
ncbi:outer membrane protein assembly factor BamE [Rhodalgimonas zhirmunskyi]|uniref:Outer membrane protein assembly factor BamE n=1 Tax=Rhodalgimonas zhirmunskyi TaxID=2964767 RepID=A0AAJ1U8H3_9RHOB|nr:outer membrane protein assembly factor BamE [Rhodoalgimonas zhirmunskyi]MDQ2093088.1 outer membrane protein assembly factor BamE [Rhodoalgimonas zhirmunskyi]